MLPAPLRPALEDLARRLRTRFGPRLRDVRLFGSWARGEQHEDSDVDVLVLVDGLTWEEWRDCIDAGTAVMLETWLPISVLAMSTEKLDELRAAERSLAYDLDHEGIPV